MLMQIKEFTGFVANVIKRLSRDLRGGSLALFGFATVPVVAFVGLSGDSAIGYMVKSRLTEAVDAAGLAAARESEDADRDAALDMFFDANFPDGYLGVTVDGPHLTPSADGFSMEITATATVPTHFMQVVGIDTMTVTARTVIERARSGMELVLVMDTTGSMCCTGDSGAKIDAMKSAAQSLIDIMFGSNQSIPHFWVGLVPYTAQVNIGDETLNRHLWLTGYNASDYSPTTWKGCVEARDYPLDTTDDPYTVAPWTPALYPNHFDNYWGSRDEILIAHLRKELDYSDGTTLPSGVATLQDLIEEYLVDRMNPKSWHDYYDDDEQLWTHVARLVLGLGSSWTIYNWDDNEIAALESYLDPHNYGGSLPSDLDERSSLLMEAWFRRSYEGRWNSQDWPQPIIRDQYTDRFSATGPNVNCGSPITPLTSQRSTITTAISDMYAWNRGGTTSNLGLVWGWRALSPRWQGLWGDASLPNSFFDPSQPTTASNQPIDKVVIILTDGNNQIVDRYGDGPDASDYTSYGRLGDGNVQIGGYGSPALDWDGARTELNRRMSEICSAMKAEGIILITITFQQNDTDTQNLFRSCASPRDPADPNGERLYFNSPTNQTLQDNFQEIANDLSRLRIAE